MVLENFFLDNQWATITVTLLVGVIFGGVVIAPIFRSLKKRAIKKQKNYIARLFGVLSKVSFLIGSILLLNLLYLLPLNLGLKNTFSFTLRVLDVIILTFLCGEFLVFIYDKYSNRKIDNKVSSLFHIIIRSLVYSAGIIVISSIFNYDIKAMLTALGVGGLAIALALQDTLGNLFAGIQILASKQLKPGDYVMVENSVEGYVLDINWRNTTLRTLAENVIIVPNSTIAKTITTNYFTLQKNLYFKVNVGVHYDSDLDFVEKVTLEVVNEVLSQYPNIPKDFEPTVRFYEFADSSINLRIRMVADLYENQFVIKHNFIKALQARYKKEGIVIPFPIRTLYMEK